MSSRRARTLLLALMCAAVGAALAVGIAGAAQVTIGFDDLASGTVVTDQYMSQGIRFGRLPTGGSGATPQVAAEAKARSVPNDARLAYCVPGAPCQPRVDAALTSPAQTISVYVGAPTGAASQRVRLDGLAQDGSVLAQATVSVAAGDAVTHLLTVTAPAGSSFAGFQLIVPSGTGDLGISFDDVSFDQPDPTPTQTTPTPTQTTPAPTPGPLPATAIGGPDHLRVGQPARFVALLAGGASHYQWDLDGDGSYEQDTGALPAVQRGFARPGKYTIGLHATFADGRTVDAKHDVFVERPPVVGLDLSPANPSPGQKIKFTVVGAAEPGTKFNVFAWDFDNLKPLKTSVGLPAPRGKATAAALTAPGELHLKGVQPTLVPRLTRSFPKAKAYQIDVRTTDDHGGVNHLHTFVGVHKGRTPGLVKKVNGIVDCANDDVYEGPCASIDVSGVPATHVQTVLVDATSNAQACLPKNVVLDKAGPLAKFEAATNLPYPAPDQFGVSVGEEPVGGQQVGAEQLAAQGARAHAAIRVEKQCINAQHTPLSWDLGDGTKIGPDANGIVPKIVKHQYAKAGIYKVKLVAKVPTLEFNPKAKNLGEAFIPKYFTAQVTMDVEVVEAFCGKLKLNTIPVSTITRGSGADDQQSTGCFLPRKTLDGKSTVYTPFPGFDVDLNTLRVKVSFGDFSSEVVVDPAAARISAVSPGTYLQLVPELNPQLIEVGGGGQSIDVPKPALDPGIGEQVSLLKSGPAAGALSFEGLTIASQDTLLSSAHGAYIRLFLRLPKPMGTETPPLVLGGGPKANLTSTAEEDAHTDYELNLDGVDFGLLKMEAPSFIKHRTVGGWFGGGVITIPAFGVQVVAPYKRPPEPGQSSAQCLRPGNAPFDERVDGPSGLSLSKSGGFEFGGIAVAGSPGPTIGPLEIHCLSVAGSTNPLVLVGKVGLFLPPGQPVFDIDGCFLFASLKGGQKASGCAADLKADEDVTWFRAAASVGIHGFVTLGSGYFDLRKGSNLLAIRAGGGIDTTYFGFKVTVGVDGTLIMQPSFAFDIYGHGEICTPDVPLIDLVIDSNVCLNGEFVVSSNGIGACITVGGFEYFWGGDVSVFAGCDMSTSSLRVSGLYPAFARPAGVPVLGGASSTAIKVPAGLRKVGFHMRGEGGHPPIPIVTGPGGVRIESDGNAGQKGRGFHVTRMGTGDTFVVVDHPRGGNWTIEAKPGSAAITGVALAKPLVEPRVLGKVTGRDSKRSLVWNATLDKADTLTFMEEGKDVVRQLGKGRRGIGSLHFNTGTSAPGKRVITAVVTRRGLPYKRYRVASYTAPKPPAVPVPTKLRARRGHGNKLAVSWVRPRGVKSTELTLTLGKRLTRFTSKGRSISLPGVDASSAVTVTVVGVSADGRHSRPGRIAVKPTRARAKPLRV